MIHGHVTHVPRARYGVGDVIEYRTFMDASRIVRVTKREANVKNGEPGFLGRELHPVTHVELAPEFEHDGGVWGYDRQILRVVKRA